MTVSDKFVDLNQRLTNTENGIASLTRTVTDLVTELRNFNIDLDNHVVQPAKLDAIHRDLGLVLKSLQQPRASPQSDRLGVIVGTSCKALPKVTR